MAVDIFEKFLKTADDSFLLKEYNKVYIELLNLGCKEGTLEWLTLLAEEKGRRKL